MCAAPVVVCSVLLCLTMRWQFVSEIIRIFEGESDEIFRGQER
jgi:hypothetical protein